MKNKTRLASRFVLFKSMSFEQKIIKALRKNRWPRGLACPECHSKRIYIIKSKVEIKKYTCQDCLCRFSDISNTPFHKTHLSLAKWIKAHELCLAAPKMTARDLKNQLHISYTAARRMKRIFQDKPSFFNNLLKILY
jgi:transposase-like protein